MSFLYKIDAANIFKPKLIVWDSPYNIFPENYDVGLKSEDFLEVFKHLNLTIKTDFFWLVIFYHSSFYKEIISAGLETKLFQKDLKNVRERIFNLTDKRKNQTSGGIDSLYKSHENYLLIGCKQFEKFGKDLKINQGSVVDVTTFKNKSKIGEKIVNKGQKFIYVYFFFKSRSFIKSSNISLSIYSFDISSFGSFSILKFVFSFSSAFTLSNSSIQELFTLISIIILII